MMVGPFVQAVLYSRLLTKLDWEAVAARCEERLQADEDDCAMGA